MDSGFHRPKLPGFRIPDYLTWGEVLFSSNKGLGAHLLFSPNGGAYLRAALMSVNMVIGNVPSLRARISAAALINFLSQLLRLF